MIHLKKQILKVLCFCAAFLIFLPLSATSGDKADTVKFIQITDTHVCNLHPYHPVFVEKRKHFGDGAKPLKEFFEIVPEKLESDFVVITGDMIDYYDAESVTGDMLDTQIEQFVRILDESEVPVYMTLGNHDIASYWVNGESSYTWSQFNSGEARAAWIRNASCFRDGTYYSRTVVAGSTTYRLIFLDNAYYDPDRGDVVPPYIIDKMQLLWLNDEMNKSDSDIELIFMHIPLLGGSGIDTEKENRILETSGIETECSLFDLLEKNRSARIMFSGHRHRNVVYEYKFPDDYTLPYVETGGFGYDTESWRLIQLTEDKIIVSSPGDTEEEYVIKLND